MTQKEVLRRIIDLMRNEMKLHDFNSSYKEQGFIRNTENAIFLYQLLIYNRTIINGSKKGFLIEPYVWVTVKKVEEYYKKITSNTELRVDTDYKTIGNSVANILANPNGLYNYKNKSLDLHIFQDEQIPDVAKQLIERFKNVAMKYFLENSRIDRVDKIVNIHPFESKVHMQNDNYRLVKGLIAAKLNNNPDLDALIKAYDEQIKENDMYNAVDEMARLKELLPKIHA